MNEFEFVLHSGGIICGVISDVIKKRSVVIVVMLVISVPSLYVFSRECLYKQ